MYKKMIEEARRAGKANEETMWKSVDHIEKLLEHMQHHHPEMYKTFMREEFELLNGPHFDCTFAMETVKNLHYTDAEGVKQSGPHWTPEQVEAAWARKVFKPSVTKWDKYVAANAIYADLCKEFDDEAVLKAAYLFFFADEDYGGDGKIWNYFMNK